IVRTIGAASERFSEDYLRMIRAVRFAVRLGFDIEPATAAGIRKLAGRIISISGERIFDELTKMLARPSAADALEKLHELNLAGEIMPEMFQHPAVWPAAISRVRRVAGRKDVVLTLAALTAELAVKDIVAMLRRWGASNELRNSLTWMAEHLDDWKTAGAQLITVSHVARPPSGVKSIKDAQPGAAVPHKASGTQPGAAVPHEMSLADFKRLLANADFNRLMRLWRLRETDDSGSQCFVRRISRRIKTISPKLISPPPFVSGDDLKQLGLSQGRQLGEILRAIYDTQLNEELSDKPAAMAAARRMINDCAK
ncbi:MAG: CCA tRNA nucleotidyltransferase, partial [Planctomycetaceae bacterium]